MEKGNVTNFSQQLPDIFQILVYDTNRKAWLGFLAWHCLGSLAFIEYIGIYIVLVHRCCLLTPVFTTTLGIFIVSSASLYLCLFPVSLFSSLTYPNLT
jgi:hypothetical protein